MRISCWFVLLALGGCSVEIDAELDVASLSIVSPAPGASFTRDQLGSAGTLVAAVPVEVAIGGDIARVAIVASDAPLGAEPGSDPSPADATALGDVVSGALAAEVAQSGAVTLTAIAYAADGTELLRGSVDIAVADPAVADCKSWLDLYRLDYTVGPAREGVADPITVTLPLNGVAYRYSGNTTQRTTLFGDCTLMKSLAEAAPIVRAHGVTEIVDIGIYNYRCIDQTKTPPNCSMSQHAYAKAIDLAAFVTGDGASYSVLNDWVIDGSGATCEAATEGDKDTFLHQLICELKADDVWNIVLTPNYNDAHRNHFHVDLTAGSDFIKRTAPAGDGVRAAIAVGTFGE